MCSVLRRRAAKSDIYALRSVVESGAAAKCDLLLVRRKSPVLAATTETSVGGMVPRHMLSCVTCCSVVLLLQREVS